MQKPTEAPTTYKKWIWKEETNTLEQISTGLQPPLNDKQLNFNKMKKGLNNPAGHLTTSKTKKTAPLTTAKLPSPIPTRRLSDSTNEEHFITLDDVKKVTLRVMSDYFEFTEQFQLTLMSKQLDELLAIMLLYFQAFFQKVDLETQEVNFDMSTMEKKTYATVLQCLEASQKVLSRSYCILILGLDTEKRHHMACGKSRKSTTKQDRDFYENLYAYCCMCIWITFSRKRELKLVEEEVGRLFRSSAFNPHSRTVVEKEFQRAYDLKEFDVEDISLVSTTRRSEKRPPIKSILEQRSPVLVSLFPNSKECAPWLLDRRTALSLKAKNKDDAGDENTLSEDLNLATLKVGIIGENISGFNPYNLTQFGTEADGDKTQKAGDSDF